MKLEKILKLVAKKYPADETMPLGAILFIFDDESGRIVKHATGSAYDYDNLLFDFSTVEELIKHLEEG